MRLLQLSLKPAQGSPGQELGLPEASRGWAVPSRRPRDPNPRRLPAPSHSRDSLSKTRVRGVLLSTWVAAEPSSFRRDRDMFPEPLGGRSSPGSEEDSLRGIRIDSFKDPPPPQEKERGIWSRLSHVSHTWGPEPPPAPRRLKEDRVDSGRGADARHRVL